MMEGIFIIISEGINLIYLITCRMLFVSTTPVQTYIFEDRKVIILTNNKIMFSHLDFIE